MSLDKVLALSGAAPQAADADLDLLLAAQLAARELCLLLASDDDDDPPKGKGGADGKDDDGDHSGHPAFKAFKKRGMPDDRAASMCARQDKKVKATTLAASLEVMLAGRPWQDISLVTLTPESETAAGRKKAASSGHALPNGTYPIEDKKHLHSAAVLAASGHGDASAAKALIRRRARELGVDVNSLPGFGKQSDEDGEKAAASMISLAAKAVGDGGAAMTHGPFNGTHSHSHFQSASHDHPHQHFNDSRHDGGPAHRPGSTPRRGETW
jgi:pyruvate/2-oxoglutarate dehydrogenase complex dihydrolipoamide acyltransferase (E2) component